MSNKPSRCSIHSRGLALPCEIKIKTLLVYARHHFSRILIYRVLTVGIHPTRDYIHGRPANPSDLCRSTFDYLFRRRRRRRDEGKRGIRSQTFVCT